MENQGVQNVAPECRGGKCGRHPHCDCESL